MLVFAFGFSNIAFAAPTNADLTLGDSRPDQTTTYTFDVATLDTGSSVACVELDLGANSNGSGAITGLDTSGSTLDSNGIVTGTTVDNGQSANHILRASKATGSAPSASGSVVWGSVVNGSTADTSYFGVFTTYSDQSCSTSIENITVQFIYTNGSTVSLSVDPAFTFTVNAVNTGSDVDSDDTSSEDTNVTSTATTVPFGTVTSTTNGIAAQDLTINTNAANGYNIYFRQTQALTNAASDTIDAVSVPQGTDCTYAVPQLFTAAGNEAFGFTTDDADISSGNYQSNVGASSYCDVTGSNQAVATRATATASTETTRVGYQAGVSTTTEPGTYSNTVIYTAVPTY